MAIILGRDDHHSNWQLVWLMARTTLQTKVLWVSLALRAMGGCIMVSATLHPRTEVEPLDLAGGEK